MRASFLALSSLLLATQGLESAHAVQPHPTSVQLEQALSGSVSERTLNRASEGKRLNVIVLLRDDADQRDLRGLSDLRGEAARQALEHRQTRVLQDVLGVMEAVASSDAAAEPLSLTPLRMTGGFATRANASEIIALASHPEVAAVYEDQLLAPSRRRGMQSDEREPDMPLSLAMVGASTVWDAGFTGEGQTIAILDSGVAHDHIALEGGVVAGACFSSTIEGQSESLCDGGVEQDTSLTSGAPGHDCATVELDPVDGLADCGHGTHLAALAAGRHVSAGRWEFSGLAPDADIIGVQIFSRFKGQDCEDAGRPNVSDCILARTSDVLEALEWLYDNHSILQTDLINMSFGSGFHREECESDVLRPIIQLLTNEGVGVVAAAGNDGYRNALASPACIPEVLSVGSVYSNLDGPQSYSVTSYTNKSNFLDILVPGDTLLSAHDLGPVSPEGECRTVDTKGSAYPSTQQNGICHYFRFWGGTSMSSPGAAGIIALMRQAFPEASMQEIISAAQVSGYSSYDLDIARGFTMMHADRLYEYMDNGGGVFEGVSIEPEAPFRAFNSTININSYEDVTYTLENTGGSPVVVEVVDAPSWLDVYPENLSIEAGGSSQLTLAFVKQLHMLPDTRFGIRDPFPRGEADSLVLASGSERFVLPVSLSAFGVIQADDQFGPFSIVENRTAGVTSIFRVAGLYSGLPRSINLVFRGESGEESENSSVLCPLNIREERYSDSEYLILQRDFPDCVEGGMDQAYIYVTPHNMSDLETMRVRRFLLTQNGRVSDVSIDPNQNVSGSVIDYWSDGYDAGRASSDELMRQGERNTRLSSLDDREASTTLRRLQSQEFRWVGDHNDLMRSSFAIEGLNGLQVRRVMLEIGNPSGDVSQIDVTEYNENLYECEVYVDDAQSSWDSYHTLPEDYADCGEFGRADVRVNFWLEGDYRQSGPIQFSRLVIGQNGAVTTISADGEGYFDLPRENENGDYSVTAFKEYEWVGDANAPTRNIFRFAPVLEPLRSIEVAVSNASQGDYNGTFNDCIIDFDRSRFTVGDYLMTSDDLAVCGDFGRADIRFRLNGRQESFGSAVYSGRIGLGAYGDLTDFGFDQDVNGGVSPDRLSNSDEVEFGPYEWVGDAEAGTQSVFRITGLNGVLPTRIQIRVSNPANGVESYENVFSDCELNVDPRRSNRGEYLIVPDDLEQCGNFRRADLYFKVSSPSDTMQDRMFMRRFAVTTAGGLTDFSFDNEQVVRVIGFD